MAPMPDINEPTLLGDALLALMTRVRDEVIPAYQSIGPAGALAVALMRRDLDLAQTAMISGDLPGMIAAYQSLKEYKL